MNRLRLWLLAFLLTPLPLVLGALLSEGALNSSFGLGLVGISLAMTAVMVPLIPPFILMNRAYEIGPDGIRVTAFVSPGLVPWSSLRKVKVWAGRGLASDRIAFALSSSRFSSLVTFNRVSAPDAAERFASSIAFYAPEVERSGRTELVRWDPSGPKDGDFLFVEPSYVALSALYWYSGAFASLGMESAVFLGPELFPVPDYRATLAIVYLLLIVAYVGGGLWSVRKAHPDGSVPVSPRFRTAVSVAGLVFVAVAAALVSLVLSQWV